jgi:hypothetical protein
MLLHIIYTENAVLLSKRLWSSWREIQDTLPGYKTSLGPWEACDTAHFLQDEYPDLRPGAEAQVQALEAGAQETIALTFEGAQ